MTRLGWVDPGADRAGGGRRSRRCCRFGPVRRGRAARRRRRRRRRAAAAAPAGALVVPVAGVPRAAITDTWGEARGGGTRAHHGDRHHGAGAARRCRGGAGTVEKLFQSAARRHHALRPLARRALDLLLRASRRLCAGHARGAGGAGGRDDRLSSATPATRARATTTSISASRGCAPGERWWQGEDVNPYPLLAGTRGR